LQGRGRPGATSIGRDRLDLCRTGVVRPITMRLSAGISVSETGGVCNKAEVGKAERKSAGNSGFRTSRL